MQTAVTAEVFLVHVRAVSDSVGTLGPTMPTGVESTSLQLWLGFEFSGLHNKTAACLIPTSIKICSSYKLCPSQL